MRINREIYLQALIDRMHNGMIKVITGIRRCGKSYLLFEIFKDYLKTTGVDDSHIIAIELDKRQNMKYHDPDVILEFIESQVTKKGNYYVFLDEVQMLDEFESVLNSLLHISNVDVYVTGSNSKFLSKDVITEFRGRGDEIHLYPLSFAEFMSVYKGDVYHGWADYVNYGGLPRVLTMKTPQQKVQYLTSLFNEVYLKDILERNKIDKTQELEDLINILASSVGSLTNPSKIEKTYKSKLQKTLTDSTIKKYIEFLEDAFIVSSAHRYDVKGRKYIGSLLKYYFEDLGLRNARLGFRQVEETHVMENIIFNELKRRGYSVDVGIVEARERNREGSMLRKQYEVDFVANLGSNRYYIQSAFSIPDEEKRQQEKASLVRIDDSFKKIVLVKDVVNVSRDNDGITTMNVYDFLLDKHSLNVDLL